MTITPQGQLYLCKTPLENDYKNQLTFANANAQLTYFNSVIQKTFDNYTYIKKDNSVKLGVNIDEIIDCNYLFYQNTGFTTKYYFCFITNMEYVNENCTLVTFETDCFQTWQFEIQYKPSFVEREHVNDDTVGLHTVPENLDVGDVVCDGQIEDISLSSYNWVVVESAWQINDNSTGTEITDSAKGTQFAGISVYNKNVFGTKLFLFKMEPITNLVNLGLFILRTNSDGHINDINNIFIVPDALISVSDLTQHTASVGGNSFSFYTLAMSDTIQEFTTTINKISSFSDYTPKNNKLLCYPYNYLFVSNNIGNNNIYKYEDFYNQNSCNFKTKLSMSVGVSGKLVPQNYKMKSQDDDETLPLAKYPTCSWSADSFTNWLTQNAVNMASSLALNVGNTITSNPTPVGIGMNISSNISQLIGSFYSGALMPNIQGGQPTGDITWSSERNTFTFSKMRAKTEYLRIIDDYFSMFGYKINRVKVPNITGRTNWNYVKTINCNFDGDIPQTDLNIIKAMFNNGTTLWHNPATIYNYGNSNNII